MRNGADRVALVLALALGLISVLILVATTIQILDHKSPDLTLSENATQILIAAIGGLTGLLGGYLGFSVKQAESPRSQFQAPGAPEERSERPER
jgi:hypothetical protein